MWRMKRREEPGDPRAAFALHSGVTPPEEGKGRGGGDPTLGARCVKLRMPGGQLLNPTQILDVSPATKAPGF